MPLKRLIRAALGAACLALPALPSGVHAAGLFLPVAPTGAVEPQGATVAMTAQEQRVRIARHELSAVRHDVENAGTGRLLLNVADGAHLDVVVEGTAPTKWGYSLSGRVAGGAGGFVTLVVHEEAVAGSIWTPHSSYELSYLGGGVHTLRDVTHAPPLKCGGALPSQLPPVPAEATVGDGLDEVTVVDILVVWTPLGEQYWYGHWGGPSETRALVGIDALVAETNHAFERSGAFVSLNLVGAERVDYADFSLHTDLGRLIDPNDGHMDYVHERRDALGADLVYLLRGTPRGVARGAFMAGTGDRRLFAHEIGHTFNVLHNRMDNQIGSSVGYSHGFTTGACELTIMSYRTECTRIRQIPLYASPWRYSPARGRSLGVSRFSTARNSRGPADAVLTINRNRHRVANHRPSLRAE